ncbi:sensor histidine kinase [Herbiconiux sp. YIM B11900]|uniref:sensor histidine kinase n=1 Tax=Herbiconiux sp. YIM B11900 TaxID=3404131 RepID=UPI003F85C755
MAAADPLARTRGAASAQLLLVCAVVVVVLFGALADPASLTPGLLAGVALIAALTVVTLVLGRNEAARVSPWMALVPLAGILACALIRAELIGMLPSVGMIVVFPVVWLAFSFPWYLAGLGVLATVGVTLYPMLEADEWPLTFAEWARVWTLPILVGLLAVGTFAVAQELRRSERRRSGAAHRMRDALRSTAEQTSTMQAITDTTADAVALFDPAGAPLLINSFAREVAIRAGIPADLRDDAGRAEVHAEVYAADRVTRLSVGPELVRRALAGAYSGATLIWVGPPGTQRAISFVARPVTGAAGELLGAVIVGHDVTSLIEAVEVRDRFLDTVGHELKTPLTAILGHAALLEAGDEASRRSAAIIEAAGERLLTAVNQLLAAGRSDIAEAAPSLVAVAPLVEGIRSRVDERAREAGVDLFVVDDGAGAARADARDLAQIVEALVSNAVAFTPPGGSVTVTLGRAAASAPQAGTVASGARAPLDVPAGDPEVVIEVADTGVGMTADELRQATDAFYRTPYAEKQAVPGLGLGLTIAHKLAVANRATLDLTSTPTGTRATLHLPAG